MSRLPCVSFQSKKLIYRVIGNRLAGQLMTTQSLLLLCLCWKGKKGKITAGMCEVCEGKSLEIDLELLSEDGRKNRVKENH